ncbi:hypothetical protein N802_09815 [Knoellia sinensis KCTC 19936]|uniref:NmrA family transcriptional regulator n=2 Tax=Knoellia TaxID=136099 RepID=A0A0A0IY98_9MICO|nr:hypothetical protein N802_09815 [Knoellia sinensis KCTC 19936]
MTVPDHAPDLGSVVILGGAGKTGARVAARLTAHGIEARFASRSTSPIFDWDDPTTWRGALEGARAAYIAYQPDLTIPGAAAAIGAVAGLAREVGVERLVLLSGRGEDGAAASEQAAFAAHPYVTVCRCAWFSQNFTEGMFADALHTGVLAMSAPGDVPEPFLDLDDLADVVVLALTEDGHSGVVHELTGPVSVTLVEAVGIVSALSGRPVDFVRVSEGEFIAGAVAQGLDEPAAAFLAGMFEELLDGRNITPATGVREALGREPRSFHDWAKDGAANDSWGGAR